MAIGRARTAACAIGVLVAWCVAAAAQQAPASGFGGRMPTILGITPDSTGERVFRLLTAHGDLWGARSKTLREETGYVGASRDKASSYIQRLTLQLSPQSVEERTRFGGSDTIRVDFTAPSAGNTAVWISRELTFTGLATPPTMAQYVGRIFADHGPPTIIADGRIYYLYRKGGQLASVGRSYTPETAVSALKSPRLPIDPPLIDAALSVDVGKCMRAVEGPPVSRDLGRLVEDATCDAAFVVWLSGVEDRLRSATFVVNDLARRAAAAAR